MLSQKLSMPISFFEVGSVVDVEYPYADSKKSKRRPAVIMKISDDEITAVLLKISSSSKFKKVSKYPYAVEVTDISSAGLRKKSWVLTNKELVIGRKNRLTLRGHLSEFDYENVKSFHELAISDRNVEKLSYE